MVRAIYEQNMLSFMKKFTPGCLLSLITVIILFVSICLLLEYVFHPAVPPHALPEDTLQYEGDTLPGLTED